MARVIYYGALRELTGKKEEKLPAGSVKECIRRIGKKYGREAQSEAKRSLITVNGKGILSLENYRTGVCDTDEVRFLPICGGG